MGKEKIALGGSSSDTTRVNIIYLDRQIKTKQNRTNLCFRFMKILQLIIIQDQIGP